MIAAVLAAGAAKRFGRCKALATHDGRPLIDWVLAALPGQLPVNIITGAYRKLLEGHFADRAEALHYNPDHEEGVASSLRCAAQLALSVQSPLLVTFADLPFVTRADYDSLLSHYHDRGLTTFASFRPSVPPTDVQEAHPATIAPPVVFAPADLHLLMTLKGDKGAKTLFTRGLAPFSSVPMPNAARDIDRSDQLHSY